MESISEGDESMDKTSYICRVQKQKTMIEGWFVGILGVVALAGMTYASLQYSGW